MAETWLVFAIPDCFHFISKILYGMAWDRIEADALILC